jgi:LAO/AO transport system kinase
VLTYSGYYEIGIDEVWNMIDKYIAFVKQNGYFEYRRNAQSKFWMYETINERLKNNFYNNQDVQRELNICEQQVLDSQMSSFAAASRVLDIYSRHS